MVTDVHGTEAEAPGIGQVRSLAKGVLAHQLLRFREVEVLHMATVEVRTAIRELGSMVVGLVKGRGTLREAVEEVRGVLEVGVEEVEAHIHSPPSINQMTLQGIQA